jgi:hypothetical protein
MNPLALTQHATTRIAQRGLRMSDVELITLIGTGTDDGYFVRTKDCQELERLLRGLLDSLRRIRGKRLVVANGKLITAYHSTKRESRRLLRRASDADLD